MRRSLCSFLLLAFVSAACSSKEAATSNGSDSVATVRRPPAATALASDVGQSDAAAPTPPDSTSLPAGGSIEYYTAAALAHVGDSLARGSTTGHMLRGRPTYQYLQIRRGRSGVPEVHDRWTDVTVVQSGRATLVSGGRVSGSHDQGGGEHRGGTIAGGSSRPVGGGDLMIIPAGTPHQYLIAPGDSLRYLTIKVLAAESGR